MEMNVRLTDRELEVLARLARGCTYARAAEELGMSAHTVASHVKNLYRKLEVHSAAAAVMRAVDMGLMEREMSE
jgi:DNA-binding CsgD family transcriptional regulator